MFLAAVTAGASDRAAAAEADISLSVLHRWRTGERPFDQTMRRRVERAHAIRERRWLESIQGAATTPSRALPSGDWRAAAWLLERTNPAFAAVSKHEVTGQGGSPLQIAHDIERRLEEPDLDRIAKVYHLLDRAGVVPLLESNGTNGNGNGTDHSDGD